MMALNKHKHLEIMATRSDYEIVIRSIEAQHSLKYILVELSDSPNLKVALSALELIDLGVTVEGKKMMQNNYMVTERDANVSIRTVLQKKGDLCYRVEFGTTPAIFFRPGGLFRQQCLIGGSISNDNDNVFAVSLMKAFSNEIRRKFTRVKSFWLGPEANQLFVNGMRCTQSIDMPAAYDLRAD